MSLYGERQTSLEEALHAVTSTIPGTRAHNAKTRHDLIVGATSDPKFTSNVPFQPYYPDFKEPWKGMYSGYLAGTSNPQALNYAQQYFNGNADEGPNRFIPLNKQTYNQYTATMYQAFLQKGIPGKVSFDQPSYEDVKKMIERDSSRKIASIDWNHMPQTKGAVEKQPMSIPGISNSKVLPDKSVNLSGSGTSFNRSVSFTPNRPQIPQNINIPVEQP